MGTYRHVFRVDAYCTRIKPIHLFLQYTIALCVDLPCDFNALWPEYPIAKAIQVWDDRGVTVLCFVRYAQT
jgi:hypothetical protein